MKNIELCEKCGLYPKYQRNGKVYKLCSVCGWSALMELLIWPDEPEKTAEEKADKALDRRAADV